MQKPQNQKHSVSDWLQGLSVGGIASLACALEVVAPKPGNVNRLADFEDTTLKDFLISGQILGTCIDRGAQHSVGHVIRDVVETTRAAVGVNTNLGLALLICPLARCVQMFGRIDRQTVGNVLGLMDADDAADVWAAIGIASPGGLGEVEHYNLADSAPNDLLAAMRLAAERDLVARQYVSEFSMVLDVVTPRLVQSTQRLGSLDLGIVRTQIGLIAEYGDSLILRKCGEEIDHQAQIRATQIRDLWDQQNDVGLVEPMLAELDFWMRSDGNRRNPGTTADLIGAGLFVGLQSGQLSSYR